MMFIYLCLDRHAEEEYNRGLEDPKTNIRTSKKN